jgi:hypothetical protein
MPHQTPNDLLRTVGCKLNRKKPNKELGRKREDIIKTDLREIHRKDENYMKLFSNRHSLTVSVI